jgi:anthranilate synthase component I
VSDGVTVSATADPPWPPQQLYARHLSLDATVATDRLAHHLACYSERMVVEPLPVAGRHRTVVAAGPLLGFTARGRHCRWRLPDGDQVRTAPTGSVFAELWRGVSGIVIRGEPVPGPLRSMLGLVSYEAARGIERLPGRHPPVVPDFLFFFPRLCVAAGPDGTDLVAYGLEPAQAAATLRTGVAAVQRAADTTASSGSPPVVTGMRSRSDRANYVSAVSRAKKHLRDGDLFQVVLALQQHLAAKVDPLWLSRRLSVASPGTLQFCYLGPSLAVTGATPEPFVTISNGQARLRPLAGTRARGATAEHDRQLECELRTSEKELAEHRMLVDLARNDLGRVCRPGSVRVDELLAVERYAHVMHLVSNVVGEIADGCTAADVLRASFPAGTMTGAPKVRAMEIIDELEQEARGFYAGMVGAVSPDEVHTYLTIRSAYLRDGAVTISAGAGIVHDSDPQAEYEECLAKLRTLTSALDLPRNRKED